MEEYNIKGTYEPASLDDVVGEAHAQKLVPLVDAEHKDSYRYRDTIVNNLKEFSKFGMAAFLLGLSVQYVRAETAITDIPRDLILTGISTGLYVVGDSYQNKNVVKSASIAPGVFSGFFLGTIASIMIHQYIK